VPQSKKRVRSTTTRLVKVRDCASETELIVVRARGAAAYDLSHDPKVRQQQLAELAAKRKETEATRRQAGPTSAAQSAKRRKEEERRALIESKRRKLLGNEEVERKREEKRRAEADKLLDDLEKQWQ
jgi:hypothetical protein